MGKAVRLVPLIGFLVLLFGCGKIKAPEQTFEYIPPAYWPTHGWQTSTPEEQGMDSELLAKAVGFAMEEDFSAHSMLVIRNGYIVADAYFYPFTPDTKHDIASCTKSFTSTLIGIAIAKNHIKSAQQPVLGFFPGHSIANVDQNKREMTLEDLLTMRTGLAWHGKDDNRNIFQMMASPDWAQFMLDLPMTGKPGTGSSTAAEVHTCYR